MSKGFCRCGICDENFTSSEAWQRHARGYKHKRLLELWKEVVIQDRFFGREEQINKAREIYAKEKHFKFR